MTVSLELGKSDTTAGIAYKSASQIFKNAKK